MVEAQPQAAALPPHCYVVQPDSDVQAAGPRPPLPGASLASAVLMPQRESQS